MFNITIREYLDKKGIKYKESNGELITACLFNDCDYDSRGSEAHLYFSEQTGQYNCKKCGVSGNLITLAKYFDDDVKDISSNFREYKKNKGKLKGKTINQVDKYYEKLTDEVLEYLREERGLSDEIIKKYKIGYGIKRRHKNFITIPIYNEKGEFIYFKLRENPRTGSDKLTSEKGVEAQIFGWKILNGKEKDRLIICEGELDKLAIESQGYPAISGTHGAMTFKKPWAEKASKFKKIYLIFDNDNTGRDSAKRIAKIIKTKNNRIYIVKLPPEVGEKGDLTDYLVKLKGNPELLFNHYAVEYPKNIDISKFKVLTMDKVSEILGLTIKQDDINKQVTFLSMLSAYTESDQFNISFNAPSSSGKSYIPLEIAKLFPKDDLIKLGGCSPTAFYHEQGEYNKEKNEKEIDLSRKILIFLDQPHNSLLSKLRSFLSHDEKRVYSKITDKNQQGGNRTKTIVLIGFPSVIFCTAGLEIDEQEASRFLLLSPEISAEKIKMGVETLLEKETNTDLFNNKLKNDPGRKLLKSRIEAIKREEIKQIQISNPDLIKDYFLKDRRLQPKHQRDVKRLISIIKAIALLNCWWRNLENQTITVSDEDIDEGINLWKKISVSQDLNLPPYVYEFFEKVIVAEFLEKMDEGLKFEECEGINRQEIAEKYYQVYGRYLNLNQFRQQIIPMLEVSGLIRQEENQQNRREKLIYLNSEPGGGVKKEKNKEVDINELDKLLK
jgi:hypothetical protein